MKDLRGSLCKFLDLLSRVDSFSTKPAASTYSNLDLCLPSSARLVCIAWAASPCTVALEILPDEMPCLIIRLAYLASLASGLTLKPVSQHLKMIVSLLVSSFLIIYYRKAGLISVTPSGHEYNFN